MNAKTQKALDGEIGRGALTRAERAELLEAQLTIDSVLIAIPVERMADLGPLVLRRIRTTSVDAPSANSSRSSEAPSRRRSAGPWLWRPRVIAITWRPAYALAAAAAFTAAAAGLVPMANRLLVRPEPQVFTEFVIQAPTASNVALAGDFSGWKPAYAMTRSATGVWTVVVPLAPGVHDYSFVIDGQRWVPDPAAPAVKDGFGGVNSRRAVLPPDGRTT